jgi:hypothetical protein
VWWVDAALVHRVSNGTDHAVRLAAILTYVGVDGSYTLARSLGIVALVGAYATLALGLLTGRGASDDRRGSLGALHRQLGAVTLVLALGHAFVPYASVVPPYGGWRTNVLPWGQPVSWGMNAASWESLGILALWLLVLTGPTYYLFRRRPRAWKVAHRLTVLAYGLVVAHVLLLGTDFMVSGAARVALLAAQVPLLVLLCRRLAPAEPRGEGARPAGGQRVTALMGWVPALVAGAASAGFAALTVLSATGEYAAGMRL